MHVTPPLRGAILLLAILMLAATAAAETNYVQIFVHPGSGTVCLDTDCQVDQGTLSGYSSTRFEGVTGGQDHTIRVYDTEGYEDYTVDIYMDYAGDSVTRTIYLDPLTTPEQPEAGSVQVFVSPGLGQVCIDGRECESAAGTPMDTWSVRFSDVESDPLHTITVTADGYQTETREVTVRPDQVTDVSVTLQPIPAESLSGDTRFTDSVPSTPRPDASPRPTRAGLSPVTAIAGIGICGALCIQRRKE